MSKMTKPPGGLDERTPDWHFNKFVTFTKRKIEINEPSPHLRMVGYMTEKYSMNDRLWLLGTYAATYNVPTGQVIWENWTHTDVLEKPRTLEKWLTKNWKGIITRTERRCVRSPAKMAECLISCAYWIENKFRELPTLAAGNTNEYYDRVYESVTGIKYFGRYISIRFVEGLRRFCGIPAYLYDVRSVGGWSPKRCMMYFHPERIGVLKTDDAKGNALMDSLTEELLVRVKETLPEVDSYVLAAMLCEYKGAFENRHQFVGHTIDQKFALYDKTMAYWGENWSHDKIWEARKAIHPWQVLGEYENRWHAYRQDLARVLRDFGYIWSDLRYDYIATRDSNSYAHPVRW